MKTEIKISKTSKGVLVKLMYDNFLLFTYCCDSNSEAEEFIDIATAKG